MMIVHNYEKLTEPFLLQQEGNYLEAIQRAQANLAKAKKVNSVRDMLDAYVDLYYCYFNELLFEEALRVYEAHKKLFTMTNERSDVMYHSMMSYMLYDVTKQYDAGIDALKKAIAIATSIRAHYIVGLANCFIGALYTRKKQHQQAMDYAALGVAYIRTFAPNLTFYVIQCEVCFAQIAISAHAFEQAHELITKLGTMYSLQQHQTIYLHFVFVKLRYLYCTDAKAAHAFRQSLIDIVATTNSHIIAKMLLPTIKHTLKDLHLQQELAFWKTYEQTLQTVITQETRELLHAFSAQQQTLLLADHSTLTLLPTSQFFECGQARFESSSKPLLLLLCQLDATEQQRSYFQFHTLQQALEQFMQQFDTSTYISCHLTQQKFAVLFECEEIHHSFPQTITVTLLDKTLEYRLYCSDTSTLTSRSNSFLEMYHLAESRLYQLVFQ